MRGIGGGQLGTISADQQEPRAIARQRNSPDVRLGVKWSPVHLRSQPTTSVLAITVVRRTVKGVRIFCTGIKRQPRPRVIAVTRRGQASARIVLLALEVEDMMASQV